MNNQASIRRFDELKKTNVFAVAGLLFFTFILFFLSLNPSLALPVLGVALAIPFFALIIKYPKVWLWTIALSSFVFFRTSDLKIGVGDILFGIFIVASTYVWLIWKFVVQREKLVESIADWFIIFFYAGMLLNIVVAMLNDITFLDWFREYSLYSSLLLYFPLKYYLKDKKDIITILILFAISVTLAAIDQVRMYQQVALAEAVYAYQLGGSVRLNQPLFTTTIFFSLILSLLPMKMIYRLMLWGLTLLTTAALIVSFSRSFWVFVIFGVFYLFFYLSRKQKKILIVGLSIVLFAGSVSFFTIFKEKADLMLIVLSNRLQSTTKGKKDVSLHLRLIEYDAVFKEIAKYPFFGNGLGKKFHFYVTNLHSTTYTRNIHNGYFFTVFRLGFPLTIVFLLVLFYNIFIAGHIARRLDAPFYRNLMLVTMISLLMLVASSLTANQFFERDSCIIMALGYAFVSNVHKKYKQKLIT